MATTQQLKVESALVNLYEGLDSLVALAQGNNVHILKAIKGNDRFKNSSTWLLLPSGNYKHLQSGKITKPERLAGYTEVVYSA
jgi:hypothetical protein